MLITVIVRSAGPERARLTFDGTQRIVIGRGPGSDVRLPDPSVSHRHATLRAQGAEFLLLDEGSTNGTFVGAVRIAPNTSRLVRSGDAVRVGRIWLELRLDLGPVTRDLASATRDLALALVSDAIAAAGEDRMARVRVVEGVDQGSAIGLAQVGYEYLVGRASHCDLRLTDPDVSREHVRVTRRDDGVVVVDTGAKNGTAMGDARIEPRSPAVWRPAHMVKIGQTVLSLDEPLRDALARIESSPDERLGPDEVFGVPIGPSAAANSSSAGPDAGASDLERRERADRGADADSPSGSAVAASPRPGPFGQLRSALRWSVADLAVMAAAIGVLAASLVGLFWLLRG